jgi:hypothetical protein
MYLGLKEIALVMDKLDDCCELEFSIFQIPSDRVASYVKQKSELKAFA